MTKLRAKLLIATVAGVTALVYLALVCLSATCLFAHAAPLEGHDHHAQHSTHSPLCAWACQATSDAGLAMDSPESSGWPVVLQAMALPKQFPPSPFSSLFHSRAPPSASFILIG